MANNFNSGGKQEFGSVYVYTANILLVPDTVKAVRKNTQSNRTIKRKTKQVFTGKKMSLGIVAG